MTTEQTNQAPIFAQLFDLLPDDKFAKPQLADKHQPNIEVGSALADTLAAPIYYPPINESVFPGDQVAIVLQSDLPHAQIVLENLLAQLANLNLEPADISVVISARTACQLGIDSKIYEHAKEILPEGEQPGTFPIQFGFHSINFQVHDPENQSGQAYLAANKAGEPVYVNRLLVDADAVLPIGCPIAGEVSQQSDCVYPDFSNETNRARFETGKSEFLARWEEIELANEALGAFFAIQIVCGPGETIQKVVSGVRPDAIKVARQATNELWAFQWSKEVDTVVATIESQPDDQSWDDFATALIAASRVSRSDGPLVVWSDISVRADKKTKTALMSQFEDGISDKLSKKMQHVAAIINERPVYLRSGLKRHEIEELGLGFIESAEEVVRISESLSSGLLIRDAHKCQIITGVQANEAGISASDNMEEN